MIRKQDEQGAQDTIARLKSLAAEHPNESRVVSALAMGLLDLSSKQNETGARDTLTCLENLIAVHPDLRVIVLEHALDRGAIDMALWLINRSEDFEL